MGKKVKNAKLLKGGQSKPTMLSMFNQYANKLADSHKKKIQKVGDTKQRLIDSKKRNRMVKVSKRTSKFALIDDEQPVHGLTHRGTKINQLSRFNDMNFQSGDQDQEFMNAHGELNFTGFEEDKAKGNEKQKVSDRPKSKSQIYKQIIEKSKLHKHLRQQVYQQNLQRATKIDQEFLQLVPKLKFRDPDTKMREKIINADVEYDKLLNELKEDERVVSNKVIQKNEKYSDNVRRKKNQQLNQLMKDSSDQEDIRDWARGANQSSQEEEDQDQIDDVQLSSEQEDSQDEDGSENQQNEFSEGEGSEDMDSEQQSEQQQNEQQQEQQESPQQIVPPPKQKKNSSKQPQKHILQNKQLLKKKQIQKLKRRK